MSMMLGCDLDLIIPAVLRRNISVGSLDAVAHLREINWVFPAIASKSVIGLRREIFSFRHGSRVASTGGLPFLQRNQITPPGSPDGLHAVVRTSTSGREWRKAIAPLEPPHAATSPVSRSIAKLHQPATETPFAATSP